MAGFIAVTGATRGIGLEVCKQLAAAGENVLLAGRNAAKLTALQKKLKKEHPNANLETGLIDISSEESIQQFFDQLSVPVKTFVNNAAIMHKGGGWTPEIFEETIQSNFRGPVSIMRKYAAAFPEGRIVNVTSSYGQLSSISRIYRKQIEAAQSLEDLFKIGFHPEGSSGTDAAYQVSKAMLNKATILFAREHPRLACSACCPGWVRSDMGGKSAPRTLEQGAASILWLVQHAHMPTGGFFRDGKPIAW